MSIGNEALNDLCRYAHKNTEHYRKLIQTEQTDLGEIPLLTQETFQREEGDFLSAEYTKYPKIDGVIIKRPIGAAGRCLKLMWDNHQLAAAMLSLAAARKNYYGIRPNMKTASFYTSQYRSNKILDVSPSKTLKNEQNILFSKVNLTKDRLQQCYEELLSFDPEILYLPPSIAGQLAELIKESSLPLPKSLRHIELSGELLGEDSREAVKEAFKIDLTNVYATGASGPIAVECREHDFHILQDNVIVEVIRDGVPVVGEEGDIYVTILKNRAMPLLRFETGDRGILMKGNCPCGNISPMLRLTHAREQDFILLPGGEKLNSYLIKNIIEFTNEYMSNSIRQFQVKQKDMGKFEMKLALKPAYIHWGQAVLDNFISNAGKTLLKDSEWEFDFTDDFAEDSNKYFIGVK